MDPELTRLIAAARTGDRRAFSQLVERYQRLAVAYAYGQLKDRDGAREAAQEAFLDAFVHLDQLRDAEAFAGWLRRIVFKHCDRRRRRKRLPTVSVDATSPDRGPAEQLELAERHAGLHRAVEGLPEHERIVVALHYLADEPLVSIAEFLSLPLSTVKKRAHSARARLKEGMQTMKTERGTVDLPERIQFFLAVRAGATAEVDEILTRAPELLDAEEAWSWDEALQAGLPLAHRVTPLILASGAGHEPLVRLLIDRGARLEGHCGCANRETALWAAVVGAQRAVARLLLEAGADVHADNNVGHTPLHVACLRGDVETAKLLLAHGADASQRSKEGLSAADWAAKRGGEELQALLSVPEAPPHPEPELAVLDERIETGIKVLDLFVPLRCGDIIRVHSAAERGVMVLMAELAYRIAMAGGSSVWVTWECRPGQERQLRQVAKEHGIDDRVHVIEGAAPRSEAGLLEVALAKVDELRKVHDTVALFVFAEKGHLAEVESRWMELSRLASLSFIMDPWTEVSAGRLGVPPPIAGQARICTEGALADARMFPAIDPVVSRGAVRDAELAVAARALLSELRAIDPGLVQRPLQELSEEEHRTVARARVLTSFLTQPFFVAEAFTGWLGEWVSRERTLETVRGILAGEHDRSDPTLLRYLGQLPSGLTSPRVL